MTDPFDRGAALVGVWRGDVPIACARVLVRDPAEEWEHDRFPKRAVYPDRALCAEISRLCIVRGERRWATLQALFVGISEALVPTGRPFFIGCCTAELTRSYEWMFGVRFTGDVIVHPDLGSKPHHMFICSYQRGMVGHGLRYLPWTSLWARLGLRYLRQGSLLQSAPRSRRLGWALRCALGTIVSPLSTLVIEARRAQQRRHRARVRARDLRSAT